MARGRTTTTYAVLGLLSVREWTAYELAKQVQRSLNWFWPRAERKLYDEPKRLVDAGLATASREHTGARGRTVYRITRKGRAALRGWLDEPPEPRTIEFEGMVKVFFADAGSRDQLLATLERIEQQAAGRLRAVSAMAAAWPPPFPQRAHLSAIGLRMQHEQEQALQSWARWAKEQVEQWRSAADPGRWDAQRILDGIADAHSRTEHISTRIGRPAGEVYDYVSDPANLPAWAAGLGTSLQHVGGRWVVDSPMGRITVAFTPRNEFGIVDHDVTLPSGDVVHNPMRVIPDGAACDVVFTLRLREGTTEEDFTRDVRAVSADLATLKQLLEAGP